MFSHFADHTKEQSVANQLRRQRFKILLDMLGAAPGQMTILDIGGKPKFWEMMLAGSDLTQTLHITLVNPTAQTSNHPTITTLVGDGRSLPQFADQQFDMALLHEERLRKGRDMVSFSYQTKTTP